MDLSNLHTSLRESEASSLRRTAHLRSTEDELNAVFRASALSLTTLYRQGVSSSKASYEKGYAHALSHVLELWERDKGWLKGYIQRRIEAIENANEDVDEEEQHVTTTDREREVTVRRSNKRNRYQRAEADEEQQDTARPTFVPPSSAFSFAAPIAYPAPTHNAASTSTTKIHRSQAAKLPDAPVIKTSNAATSRRKLQKLKGLRAGRDRIVEIEHKEDDMVDEDDSAAWTDEDATGEEEKRGASKKSVVWAERSNADAEEEGQGRVIERLDRRKRRRSTQPPQQMEEELRDAPYHS